MTTRLVNVRLERGAHSQGPGLLRASGIAVSDLLRDAIDRRYEQVVRSPKGLDVAAIMRRIFEQHPDPPNLAPRRYERARPSGGATGHPSPIASENAMILIASSTSMPG